MIQNYSVFSTHSNFYIYDVGCNRFTTISNEFYNSIQDKSELIESFEEYHKLRKMGFFTNDIRLKRNPATDVLPLLIDRQMQVMVLQVTQGCNLRCQYCPYSQTNKLTRSHSNKVMSWITAKKAIDFLCNHSVDSHFVTLDFYGGEPLLNFELIKKSVFYIKERLYGKDLNFGITTNATLLTEDIMDFLEKNKFTLVISLDGDQASNDKNRKFVNDSTLSVFSNVMGKIETIHKKHNNLFEKLSLNMVLDPVIDYSEYEKLLFEYPYLKELAIDIVVKDDSYSDAKNIWSEAFSKKYYYKLFLGYLRSLFRFEFKDELQYFASVSNVFDRDVYNMQISNSLYSNNDVTPSGMCFLGHDKVFVTTEGEFYPCERVNETDEMIRIGDVNNGFDLNKVKKIYNYHEFFKDRCLSCIAVRECDMCLNNFGSTGLHDNNSTISICKKNREEFIDKLKRRAILNEAKQILSKINTEGNNNEY